MKKTEVTIVSEKLPKGCGLYTYNGFLVDNLKKRGMAIRFSAPKKILGNYPVSLSPPIKTMIAHFTDQKTAPILLLSPFRKYKAVLTVHDVIEIINFRDIYGTGKIKPFLVHKFWSFMIKQGMKKADTIIAVSEHTKKDIIGLIGKRKIEVIYEAADKKFRPQKVRKSPQTILYIGSNLPHKNLITLLKAFSILLKRLPKAKLVLIGGTLPEDNGLRKEIKKLGIQDNVVFRGYIENTLPEYSKAGVFVFPSIYEGFGLPVLEAMACGCPVICSNKTSLPEVAGDAALYFDGDDTLDLSNKIYKVINNNNLQERMRKKGLERAKMFAWEKTAKETIRAYEKLNV